MSKKSAKSYYFLEDGAAWKCQSEYVNRTAFVDIKYGSRRGQLNDQNRPFNSINAAIAAIKLIPRSIKNQWLIKVNAGHYDEIVVVPRFINITGAGMNVTSVAGLHIRGTSNVTNLAISNNILPLIRTDLTSSDPLDNIVHIDQIKITATAVADTKGNPFIETRGEGANAMTILKTAIVDAVVLRSNPSTSSQSLFVVGAPLVLDSTICTFSANYASEANFFEVNSNLTIAGGANRFIINDGPAQQINMFKVNNGEITVQGNSSTISVLLLENPYKSEVSFIKIHNGQLVNITNSTAHLDGVSQQSLNLVHSLSSSVEVSLLGLTTPNISMPRLKGFKERIKYFGISGDGDMVSNGGLYTNITNVEPAGNTGGYFVQENDHTIISNGVNIHLFDPALANTVVLDTGKIVIIRNTSPTSIMVDAQNNAIFDGTQTVQQGRSLTLQNNGVKWYRISNL